MKNQRVLAGIVTLIAAIIVGLLMTSPPKEQAPVTANPQNGLTAPAPEAAPGQPGLTGQPGLEGQPGIGQPAPGAAAPVPLPPGTQMNGLPPLPAGAPAIPAPQLPAGAAAPVPAPMPAPAPADASTAPMSPAPAGQ